MRKFLDQLAALNTRFIARLGAALFVPALTLLMNKDSAAAVIQAVFPKLPATIVPFAAVSLAGFAGFLLYQGKPEKTQ